MILGGGDPTTLKLAEYLDVAYTIQVREAVRLGITLDDALDNYTEWGRSSARPAKRDVDVAAPGRAARVRQNNAALAALQARMGGAR